MSAVVARRDERAVFIEGSTMRHVAVMTATGTVGMLAVFAVDFLSLFWVARLGDESLKAAVGYASQVMFVAMAVNIGLTIACSAVVARALGRGDPENARSLAASALALSTVLPGLMTLLLLWGRQSVLASGLHAEGHALDVAGRYLLITLPANVPMGLGMALSGVLRAAGDARRAMYVTLFGAVATAFADPLFIFGFGLGVYGAAWATVVSRLTFVVVGLYGAHWVHNLIGTISLRAFRANAAPILAIGAPAILTNLATPVASLYVTRVWSDFGEATVAGGTIIDRVTPLAFCAIFALTGAVGPVIGQNLGAGLYARVRRTIVDSLTLSVLYSLVAWGLLVAMTPTIVAAFGATGASAEFVELSLRYGCAVWIFLTCIFVGNAAFNNLGFPILATAFNWGRATLGTIPFATAGASWGGVRGAIFGLVTGTALFGIASVFTSLKVTADLAKKGKGG